MSKLPHKKLILGLGLDDTEGHRRLTRGPNFQLFGGSQPTHERMQETCIRFNEELQKRGKTLAEISPKEAQNIMRDIDSRL